jgi:preprotein translocase subunit Sec61beta
MEGHQMSEPVTGAAGAGLIKVFGLKAVLGTIGAVWGTIVVMIKTRPKGAKEWACALASSFVSSYSIGLGLVHYFDMVERFGINIVPGVLFVCALPGWTTVRAYFAWSESDPDKSLIDRIQEARRAWKG